MKLSFSETVQPTSEEASRQAQQSSAECVKEKNEIAEAEAAGACLRLRELRSIGYESAFSYAGANEGSESVCGESRRTDVSICRG